MADHGHSHDHGHAHDHGHGHDHGHEGHGDHPDYVKTWKILMALLLVSVAGPMLEIPILTLITAFGIAVIKAYMVLVNFMHVKLEKKYVAYLLATMVAFMLVFFFGVAPDVMRHEGHHWENVAAKTAEHHTKPTGHGHH